MIRLTLPGEPIAKQRPRFSRKGTYDPQFSQKHAARFQILSQINRDGILPFPPIVSCEVEFRFFFNTPDDRKNLVAWGISPHITKPDIDNIFKFYLDCLNGIIFNDDQQVTKCSSEKLYSDKPRTEILIMPKKPACDEKVKEVLSIVEPTYLTQLAEDLSWICDEIHINGEVELDYERVAFLICEFSEKHADNLKKINKKFPGFASVLRERMGEK